MEDIIKLIDKRIAILFIRKEKALSLGKCFGLQHLDNEIEFLRGFKIYIVKAI